MTDQIYDNIINNIIARTGLSKEEVELKVSNKMSQLSGLITKEGALHIIMNEIGLKITNEFNEPAKRLKIKDIISGINNLEITGKILQIYELRSFIVNNREGKVLNILIGDETGTARVVIWGQKTDEALRLKQGDIIKIKNAFSKENQGRKEIHLRERSEIIINPEGEVITVLENIILTQKEYKRKYVINITENENVEVLGTIVQVFEPRFFEICPRCNKRLKIKETGLFCDVHGDVQPSHSYVINASLDDGTGIIRIVFFRNQAAIFLGMTNTQIIELKEKIELFKQKQNELVGTIVKIDGRASKNNLFDRSELIVDKVYLTPDPEEEIKKLNTEIEKLRL